MRRRSFGAITTIQSPKKKECDTLNKDDDDVIDEISEKRNLRKVMNARRKSFSSVAAIVPLNTGFLVTVAVSIEAAESVNMQAVGQTVSVVAVAEAVAPDVEVAEQQEASLVPCMLNSPLRQAINARRRSSLSFAETAGTLSAEGQVQSVEKISLVVKKDHMQQFVSTQVSRRLSMGGRSVPADDNAKALRRKSIAVPRYQPTARLSSEEEQDSNAGILAELAVDEDIVLTCKAANRKTILRLSLNDETAHSDRSPYRTTLKTPLKSSVHREVAVKQALCVQLAVDAFASELEMQVRYLILFSFKLIDQ